jgi:outer membrane biosynthesis protein TonB
MSASENRESGAARLLTDVLAGGQPDRELLIRYARTPGSLSDAERAEVERLLAENPRYADRLRVLQSFSAAAALREEERPVATVRRLAPARRVRRFVLAALPAAAAMVFAVVYAVQQSPSRGFGTLTQVAERDTPGVPETLDNSDAPVVPQTDPVEPATPSQGAAPVPAPAQPAEPAPQPAPDPTGMAEAKPAPEPPAPVPAPEPEPMVAEAKAEPAAAPTPEPEGFEPGVLVAMADLEYDAPEGAADRPRVSSALRGGALRTSLTAVVPEHIAQTGKAQPSLFWHVDVLPDPSLPFTFTITDEASLETLVRAALPRPERPGLQRIDLRDFNVELTPGTEYRWSVFLRPDPNQRSLDRLAQGWIRRVETAPLADGVAQATAQAASRGLWYDAVAGVVDVLDAQPENATAQRALRQLLEQAGLASIAP